MKRKLLTALILVVAAVALVAVSVMGTIAYLTSTATVTNTFTVGNVGILMYESSVDNNGTKIKDTDKNGSMKDSITNQYRLLPGKTYDKDPTIYVTADSEASYLFVEIQNGIKDIEDNRDNSETKTIHEQMVANGWYPIEDNGNIYLYCGTNQAGTPKYVGGTDLETIDVFTSFTISPDAHVDTYSTASIVVKAYAIQHSGIDTKEEAWNAIQEEYNAGASTP